MKNPSANLKELDRLVEEALERPKDERTAFLRAKCGDDPDLYNEVVSLLEMFDKAEGELGDSAVDYAAPVLEADGVDAESIDQELAEEIGPYRLLKEIGRGGMGTVYVAERTDGVYDQHVALKLVNVGLAPEFVSRFRSERQILASLNHPGIARLLDGGETGDGRPYLVMEYVPGESITAYADRNRLTIDQRLRLFGQVCDAVAYAHRNLVVHRDLKPSNVLVSEDDEGGPTVKLLDFGIAKLLEEDGEGAQTTTIGNRMMTPDYAAPEQVAGGAVTTSTDVYALGVLLYRLLTGHRPYHITSKSRYAVEEAILAAKHVEPSVAVSQTEERTQADGTTTSISPEDVAKARSSDPQRLGRRLHGDLDTIVLKALRKEPERRYGSAEALGRDLTRHLTGLPVEARPDKLGYRIGKFVQRHRVGVGAASLVFAVLMLGIGLTLWQSGERAREAARADTARDFALSLFSLADPDEARGDAITTEDLLDRGAERAMDELIDQPEVQEQMLLALAGINYRLSRYDQAGDQYAYVYAQRSARLGSEDPAVAEALAGLATLAMAQGEAVQADSLFAIVLAIQRQHDDPLALAQTLDSYGVLARRENNLDEAEARLREALVLRRRHAGPESQDVVESLKNLALVQHQRDAFDEAEALYRSALTRQVALGGEFHPDVGILSNSLASLLRTQGRFAEADSLYQRALAVYGRVYPDGSRQVVTALAQWSTLLIERGQPEAAQTPAEEAVAMARRLFGDNHSSVALASNVLALSLAEQERYTEAIAVQEEVVTLYEGGPGPNHPFTAIALSGLATHHLDGGDAATAENLLQRAWAIQEETLEPDHLDHARTILRLGRVALAQGRAGEAEPLLREALPIFVEQIGEDHPHTAEVQSWLGASLTAQGRLAEAEPFIEASARYLQKEARRSIQRAIRANLAAYRAAGGG